MNPVPELKVCGLTRLDDIAGCLGADIRYLGINRYEPSPRFVTGSALPALVAAIPPGRRVYVDVAPDLAKLNAAVAAGFDWFQIHFDPDTTPESTVAAWAEQTGNAALWLAPRLRGGALFPGRLLKYAGTFLIDGYSPGAFGGTGKTADWAGVAALTAAHPGKTWIVAGGLGPDNLAGAAELSHADILDLNSGIEDSPGVKNLSKLAAALTRLRGPKDSRARLA